MKLSHEQIISTISKHLPDFSPAGELKKLSGGKLNHVWRLKAKPKNLIIKYAPPYIANNPEVPLSPKRIRFGAEALELFEKKGRLKGLVTTQIRPPHILLFDEEQHLLILEDIGEVPNITNWLVNIKNIAIGHLLGDFIGQLHRQTLDDERLHRQFNNQDIQQTRLQVQYNPAAEYAAKAGIADTINIESKTKELGQKLLSMGQCLVMGDLWPPSVLVSEGMTIRLIDWEFVHFGRPLQDIAHFAAHCWMQAHTSSSKEQKQLFRDLWTQFWKGYQQALEKSFSVLFNEEEFDDATTHIGAEILIRAAGPFKDGYVYQDFDPDDEIIKEAGQKAKELILDYDFSSLWMD